MISVKEISEERGIEEEFVLEFLNEFYDYTINGDLPQLCEALNTNNLKVVAERAHSIKGAANNLMLNDIAQCSEEILNCCKKKDDAELGRLTRLLEQHLKEFGSSLARISSSEG